METLFIYLKGLPHKVGFHFYYGERMRTFPWVEFTLTVNTNIYIKYKL